MSKLPALLNNLVLILTNDKYTPLLGEHEGRVVAVGPGRYLGRTDWGEMRHRMSVKVGDTVRFIEAKSDLVAIQRIRYVVVEDSAIIHKVSETIDRTPKWTTSPIPPML